MPRRQWTFPYAPSRHIALDGVAIESEFDDVDDERSLWSRSSVESDGVDGEDGGMNVEAANMDSSSSDSSSSDGSSSDSSSSDSSSSDSSSSDCSSSDSSSSNSFSVDSSSSNSSSLNGASLTSHPSVNEKAGDIKAAG